MSALLCVILVTLQISRSWQALATCEDVLGHRSCGLVPGPERCGRQAPRPQARVFGGKAARLGEYPWIARLGYVRRGSHTPTVLYRCGGSLISDRYILTAAHCCLLNHLVTVRLGELDTSKATDCTRGRCAGPVQDYKVESFTVHEEYDFATLENDVCLVRLKYPVEFNVYVSPICLPYSDILKDYGATFTMEIAGWGKSYERPDGTYGNPEVLQKLRLPLVPLATCQYMFQRQNINITSKQLCAGGIPGDSACSGDSGGPLMVRYHVKQSHPRFIVAGVTSFAQIQPCAGKFPSVYVNVFKYITWILDNMTP